MNDTNFFLILLRTVEAMQQEFKKNDYFFWSGKRISCGTWDVGVLPDISSPKIFFHHKIIVWQNCGHVTRDERRLVEFGKLIVVGNSFFFVSSSSRWKLVAKLLANQPSNHQTYFIFQRSFISFVCRVWLVAGDVWLRNKCPFFIWLQRHMWCSDGLHWWCHIS